MLTLPYRIILVSEYRQNEGNGKLPLNHDSNCCCRQGPLVKPKISGKNFKDNQHSYMVLKSVILKEFISTVSVLTYVHRFIEILSLGNVT